MIGKLFIGYFLLYSIMMIILLNITGFRKIKKDIPQKKKKQLILVARIFASFVSIFLIGLIGYVFYVKVYINYNEWDFLNYLLQRQTLTLQERERKERRKSDELVGYTLFGICILVLFSLPLQVLFRNIDNFNEEQMKNFQKAIWASFVWLIWMGLFLCFLMYFVEDKKIRV